MPQSGKKGPLSLGAVDLVLDLRRRIVLPHKVVPAVVELHTTLARLFEAVYTATSDRRWLEAAELILNAAQVLRAPSVSASPVELVPGRSTFEAPSWARKIARKPMAVVRLVKPPRRR
jgi:hypothetical protein